MWHAVRATRIGSDAAAALATAGRGSLRAVYARAAALVLDDGTHLGLLAEGAPLHPWAVNVPLAWRAEDVGLTAEVAGGELRVGHLRIALGDAEVVALELRQRPRRLPVGLAARLAAAGAPAAPPFAAALERPLSALRAGEVGAAWGLCGLGEGLTPSGDDLLVGALAAWDYLADCLATARARRAALCAARPSELAARTTRLAAQLLDAAIAGRYAEPLLALFAAAELGDAAWDEAVGGVLACGHRSGADLLAGVSAAVGAATAGADATG